MGYRKNLTNPYLYRQFSNSPQEMFNYTMTNLMDSFYDTALSEATDGAFKAVCLSGIRTEDNNGDGIVDENDAEKVLGYLNVIVRPLTPFGGILPDPAGMTDANEINQIISLHASVFTARSDFEAKNMDAPMFGEILNCYFEQGSIANSDFRGLRFSKVVGDKDFNNDYKNLAYVEGVVNIVDKDWSGASLLGIDTASTGAPPTASQIAFETKLKAALESKGLKFHVTDRSRTVDDQMQRIMNKYKNNGPQEVVATYGKNRGAKMVKAIKNGDTATFRSLASQSSRHLKGNAIDIRSWHYTNEQIPIVLDEIRKLGGNPLLENIEG